MSAFYLFRHNCKDFQDQLQSNWTFFVLFRSELRCWQKQNIDDVNTMSCSVWALCNNLENPWIAVDHPCSTPETVHQLSL